MRVLVMSALMLIGGCANASEAGSKPAQPDVLSQIVESEAGTYRVVVNPSIDQSVLPQNPDLRMLDGDLSQYSIELCGLDFRGATSPEHCEIFFQSEPGGLLTGYIALRQSSVVDIATALTTDRQRSGLGCFMNGEIQNSNFEDGDRSVDIASDFAARLPFFGLEKSPGDWMISSEGDDPNSAGGMWYLERRNDNLRISQERWNYCYQDDRIAIDEVFTHVASISRVDN